MKIAISGELGSGKTLLGKLICKKLNYKFISVGSIQRELAEKYNMSTIEFNKYMESHPEIDHECDNKIIEYGKSDIDLILDSRLAWHFIPNAFKIHLIVNMSVAATRIFNDNVRKNELNKDIDETIQNIKLRKESEIKRFKEQYNVDIDCLGNYNIVVDTTYITPNNLADFIIERFEKWNLNNTLVPNIWLSPKNIFPMQNLIESFSQKILGVKQSIISKGYNELEPIQVIKNANNFFIFDGHKRCSAMIGIGLALIPAVIINLENTVLPNGQTVNDYLKDKYALKNIYDWENMHNFKFLKYF